MDFLDPYNIAGRASTPPVRSSDAPESGSEPSLNEEINEVIGQFGKFWGGFRKQSQAAFEAARKDIGEVVNQAQKELSKFAPISEPTTVLDAESTEDSNAEVGSSREVVEEQQPSSSSSSPEYVTSPIQTLFSRIQSSLPPNISATLQENLPSSLKDASGNVHIDFTQLTSTLSTEFQRVQGVTRAQAEEYVHKSEALLKEAGEFLKEAVKVVPPNPNDGDNTNMVWDGMGSDMWIMPSPIGTHGWGASSASSIKGKGKMRNNLNAGTASHLAAGSRVEALLQRLKRDPEMIKLNPMEDDAVKAMYEEWVKNEVDAREGRMDSDFWRERIKIELEDKVSGAALSATRDAVVPSIMDEQTFWIRYFFRIFQIESEEERRKAILSGASETPDEDFSWEDEDEDDAITPGSTSKTVPSIRGIVDSRQSNETLVDHKAAKAVFENKSDSLSVTPATTSPRDSSESSFDVVSSGHLSSFSEVTGPDSRAERVEKEEDVDSDWE